MAIGVLPLTAAPASAAPPGNDEPQGAVVLHLGDRVAQDTTEATTSPQDEALNSACGAPATNASVWYSYSPSTNSTVLLDMTASSYSGGMLVFAGATPTADALQTCGAGMVVVRARAGKTYTIMAISDTDVKGGRLVLSVKKPPPPPRVHVTVARRGAAFRGGDAQLHGTYSCANADVTVLADILLQRAGRLKIQAESGQEIRCDGRRHSWSARLVSPVGTYARGHASAQVAISACGILTCSDDSTSRRVHLAWAKGSHRHRFPAGSAPTRMPRPRPLVQQQRHWPGSQS